MPFRHVRAAYEKLREQERLKLLKYLQAYFKKEKKAINAELQVLTEGGRGAVNFKPSDEGPAFDLRNWKWIRVTGKNGFECTISLNLPSVARDTGMPVACYDRVGLATSKEKESVVWIDTKMTLPLNAKKLKAIARCVLDQI